MNIYIGIDPSINSTGICIQFFENNKLTNTEFYIVKPDKLTKKEEKVNIKNFHYIVYDKIDLSIYKGMNYIEEHWKTVNLLNIVDNIENIIIKTIGRKRPEKIIIVEEGISYGSTLKTKSIFDLAGLNYLIRSKFMKWKDNCTLFIGTPGEIKKFATGKGNANKDLIVACFKNIFIDLCKSVPKVDDIADAYFMSCYAKYLYENK